MFCKRVLRATIIALCLIPHFASFARADANSEMVVKALMVGKFIEFIKWPTPASPQQQMQVKICVYGDSAMSQMQAVFSKLSSNSSLKYSLSHIAQLAEATGNCHIIFIGTVKGETTSSTLSALAGKPLLTVSDSDGFVEKGGMVGFQIIDGKVRYNINNRAFGEAQLKIDAQLLEIANKVVE